MGPTYSGLALGPGRRQGEGGNGIGGGGATAAPPHQQHGEAPNNSPSLHSTPEPVPRVHRGNRPLPSSSVDSSPRRSRGMFIRVMLLRGPLATCEDWLHYTTTLHYTTLHYTTLHYTTLHYTTRLGGMAGLRQLPAIRGAAIEPLRSTLRRPSTMGGRPAHDAPLRTFTAGPEIDRVGWEASISDLLSLRGPSFEAVIPRPKPRHPLRRMVLAGHSNDNSYLFSTLFSRISASLDPRSRARRYQRVAAARSPRTPFKRARARNKGS